MSALGFKFTAYFFFSSPLPTINHISLFAFREDTQHLLNNPLRTMKPADAQCDWLREPREPSVDAFVHQIGTVAPSDTGV